MTFYKSGYCWEPKSPDCEHVNTVTDDIIRKAMEAGKMRSCPRQEPSWSEIAWLSSTPPTLWGSGVGRWLGVRCEVVSWEVEWARTGYSLQSCSSIRLLFSLVTWWLVLRAGGSMSCRMTHVGPFYTKPALPVFLLFVCLSLILILRSGGCDCWWAKDSFPVWCPHNTIIHSVGTVNYGIMQNIKHASIRLCRKYFTAGVT